MSVVQTDDLILTNGKWEKVMNSILHLEAQSIKLLVESLPLPPPSLSRPLSLSGSLQTRMRLLTALPNMVVASHIATVQI